MALCGKSFWSFCLIAAVFCGCSSNSDNTKETNDQTSALPGSPGQLLIGSWYGRARLDQQKLSDKINSIADEARRARLQTISKTFQTTEIGARFEEDGTMELDIEIHMADGQKLRDSTSGRFQIVEESGNAVIVETEERLPGGGTEKNRVRYQFEQNGVIAIMVAPTSADLADCDPLFVFQRIDNGESRVAARPNEPRTK